MDAKKRNGNARGTGSAGRGSNARVWVGGRAFLGRNGRKLRPNTPQPRARETFTSTSAEFGTFALPASAHTPAPPPYVPAHLSYPPLIPPAVRQPRSRTNAPAYETLPISPSVSHHFQTRLPFKLERGPRPTSRRAARAPPRPRFRGPASCSSPRALGAPGSGGGRRARAAAFGRRRSKFWKRRFDFVRRAVYV